MATRSIPSTHFFRWGDTQLPVLVMDDVHPDPHGLVQAINANSEFTHQSRDLYPGERAIASEAYRNFITQTLINTALEALHAHQAISSTSQLEGTPFCVFSRTNLPANALLPIQCIPHFDCTYDDGEGDGEVPSPMQWALVHYLFDGNFGGTGFFRHHSSQLEAITKQTQGRYQRMLNDDIHRYGKPEQVYLQSAHPLFSLEAKVEAKYNRAILYPAHVLHSGLVNDEAIIQYGGARLTANALLSLT